MNDLNLARTEVSQSSAGGAPFLLCFGATIFVCAVAGFYLPPKTAALMLMFQGGVALPAAFMLERRMGWGPMAKDNPLNALSVQLAMSQIVGVPHRDCGVRLAARAVSRSPWPPSRAATSSRTPGCSARTCTRPSQSRFPQVHWSCRSSWAAQAFPIILLWMSGCYWIGAPLVYRAARRLTLHS